MPPDVDGYTKGTQVHRLGSPVDAAKEIHTIHPYSARLEFVMTLYQTVKSLFCRSLVKRFPYINDHTHSHKKHSAMIGTV